MALWRDEIQAEDQELLFQQPGKISEDSVSIVKYCRHVAYEGMVDVLLTQQNIYEGKQQGEICMYGMCRAFRSFP